MIAEREFALFRLWLALGFVACAVVFYGCLMHNPPQGPDIRDFDKVEHFTAYVILGVWFAGLLAPRYIAVFIGLACFGAFIEVVQYYSGYRDGDPYDWLADCLGLIVGIALAHYGAMHWLRYIDRRVTANRNSTG